MKTYNEILERKMDHYGETKAAYEFAAEEYADQFKPKWIPVSERLPDNDDEVLVIINYTEQPIMAYFKHEKWFGSLATRDEMKSCSADDPELLDSDWVTHWMPLPPKPETV